MPKRKRGHYVAAGNNPATELELKEQDVEKKLHHGKTLLTRALKNARPLQHLKLRQKLKPAVENNNVLEITKLQNELDVLKVRLLMLPLADFTDVNGPGSRPQNRCRCVPSQDIA